MQNNKSSKKTIIISIVIVLLAMGTYFYMKGSPEDTTSSLGIMGDIDSPAMTVGSDVLALLNQLNSINIDGKFFESTVYKSLVDHTVIVPEQRVGKPNPFLKIFGN